MDRIHSESSSEGSSTSEEGEGQVECVTEDDDAASAITEDDSQREVGDLSISQQGKEGQASSIPKADTNEIVEGGSAGIKGKDGDTGQSSTTDGILTDSGTSDGTDKGTDLPTTPTVVKDGGFPSLIPYISLVFVVVVGISIFVFFLWKGYDNNVPPKILLILFSCVKYFPFAEGRRRRRRYKHMEQMRGPSLEEEITDHMEHVNIPTASFGYTMTKRRPSLRSTPQKQHKRVNKRTIIDIHLEVLDECKKADWELTKQDLLEILALEFMQKEHSACMKDQNIGNYRTKCNNVSFDDPIGTDTGLSTGRGSMVQIPRDRVHRVVVPRLEVRGMEFPGFDNIEQEEKEEKEKFKNILRHRSIRT
ncbi:hypothetical protein PCYB_001660 [Plasmodium cynomolgi strain B]|uniref:Schizont-infected cell agglutination C-terminal domain-containing protein n=1 Tax=Plasmodium cynomolgi (strain B) TaxID=1120755 RepID=K6UNE6_PLACD|nr:hypothetical protein PCYB_001660 [Plasmodium cynomolgi strain B]GAB69418.1 hypothetical protein PCYB_001660 [Plasmodium cynomolgi strain B]